jgi:hypothetical protein
LRNPISGGCGLLEFSLLRDENPIVSPYLD